MGIGNKKMDHAISIEIHLERSKIVKVTSRLNLRERREERESKLKSLRFDKQLL